MNKLFAVVALTSVVIFAGCNTVRGVGQDVSKAGDKVSEAATKTQNQ